MSTTTTTPTRKARKAGQGSKWIRRERRLAIYMRDGLACVWCGVGIEDQATLDHCKVNVNGGTNDTSNLVTSCARCNSSRGARSLAEFARAVALYLNHGVSADDILAHVNNCRRRKIDVPAAKALIARRGSVRDSIGG